MGSTPVVLVFDGRSESGSVYRRELTGALLIFQPTGTALQMRDRDTSSTWDGITGRALDGPLVGASLDPVPITYSFWFGWADFYPQTSLYK